MLKNKTQVFLVGYIIYAMYIAGFQWVFAPIHYGILFYATVVCYAVVFYVWISTSECQSYTQAQKAAKKLFAPKNQKYKSDAAYAAASLISIIVLLISISLPLCGMWANQNGIYHIGWILQTLIFIAGAAMLYICPMTYEMIGDYQFLNPEKKSSTSHNTSTSASDALAGMYKAWKAAGEPTLHSPQLSDETKSSINKACSVFRKKSWVSQNAYNEAIKIVDKILIDSLGINAYKISHDASLSNDLHASENDQKNIDNIIYQRLKDGYNLVTFCKKHDFKYIKYNISNHTDKFIINVLEQLDYAHYLKNPSEFTTPPKTPTTPIWEIVHTVGDWYDIVADVIHYYYHPASISVDISFSHKKSWISQEEYIEAVTMVNHFLIEILYIDKNELSPGLKLIDNLASEDDMIDIDNLIYQSLNEEYDFRSFCEKTDFDRASISTTTDKYATNTIEQVLYTLYLKNPDHFTSPPKEPTTPIWEIVHTAEDWYDVVADVIHYYYNPIHRTDSQK